MQKKLEVSNPDSCLGKAKEDEMIFVLRAKDPVAPHVIREWVKARIEAGLNTPSESKVKEALLSASVMEQQRAGGMFDIKQPSDE